MNLIKAVNFIVLSSFVSRILTLDEDLACSLVKMIAVKI